MHDLQYLSFKICHPKPSTLPLRSNNMCQFPFFPIPVPILWTIKSQVYRGKVALLSKEWERMGMAHFERRELLSRTHVTQPKVVYRGHKLLEQYALCYSEKQPADRRFAPSSHAQRV